jgi:phosphoenolpyruvate carboxylase
MYDQWPFFNGLLSNIQMALFKTDLTIGAEYAKLGRNPQIAQKIYSMIAEEHTRGVQRILEITGNEYLMAETPALALSLNRRTPYLEPLNNIQVAILRRYKDEALSDEEKAHWLTPLLNSINAIAAGMRNTG